MNSNDILREYIRAIAFPAAHNRHKIFLYRAQSDFPYRNLKKDLDIPTDDDDKEALEEDDMIYVLRSKSSKNMAGSKRGWSSPHVPIPTKEKKKNYFSLKSLINIDKKV